MKTLSIAAAAAFSLLLVACGDSSDDGQDELGTPYPESIRGPIVTECVANGAPEEICECVVSEMEKTIPVSSLMAEGLRSQFTDEMSEDMTEKATAAGMACAAKMMGEES